MMNKKINIIFPYNSVGGAFRSTYEISNRLKRLGYDVIIYFPFFPLMDEHKLFSLKGISFYFRGMARSLIRRNKIFWFECDFKIKMVPFLNDTFIRDADIVIANHWITAKRVYNLSKSKGEKYYFIRDIEHWVPHFNKVIEAFKLEMKRLVTTEFIRNYLSLKLGLEITDVIRNGFNFNNFQVEEKKYSHTDPTISMIFSNHPMKGVDGGIECLKRIKTKYPNCKIILFGFPNKPLLDFNFDYIQGPVREHLRDIYAKTDIFLCPSIQEGWHNPPSEAMAAKCAVVATNVGSVLYTIEDSVNGFKVEPNDIDGMEQCIVKLMQDRELRVFISENAYHSIQGLTWDEPIEKLDKLFNN